MTSLLHIDSSPRDGRSHSRALTRHFTEAWRAAHPHGTIAYRDVGHAPPPHVDEPWIAAAFTPPGTRSREMRDALSTSDALVDELLAADLVLVGLPMYNFTVPSTLKAYIDQVVRLGRTFDFDPLDEAHPYRPRLSGKRGIAVVSTGDAGYEAGGPHEGANHVEPYLRTVFGFLGITDLTCVYVSHDEFGGERQAASLAQARERLLALAGG